MCPIDQRPQRTFEERLADFSPELNRFIRVAWSNRMAIDLQHATQGADQLYHLYRGHIGGRQLDRQALQLFLDRMVNLAAGRHTFVQGGGEVTSLDDLADPDVLVSHRKLWKAFYHVGQGHGATKRVYVHATDMAAGLRLMEAAAGWLDEIPGFLKIKICGPGAIDRNDTIVAYLDDQWAQAELVRRFEAMLRQVPGLVADRLPPTVRRVGVGLGIADEPPEFHVYNADKGKHSFGEFYASILWLALSTTPDCKLPTADGRHLLDNVLYVLRSLGVNPQVPHEFPDRERLVEFDRRFRAMGNQAVVAHPRPAARAPSVMQMIVPVRGVETLDMT